MKINCKIAPETFRLVRGTTNCFDLSSAKYLGNELSVSCARGDTAACQIIFSPDCDCIAMHGDAPFFSQSGAVDTIRFSSEYKDFEESCNFVGIHIDDDRFMKGDSLLPFPVIEAVRGEIYSLYAEFSIPENAAPGDYVQKITLYGGKMFEDEKPLASLSLKIKVYDFIMPKPGEYRFHLDLWQHCSNIARKHETPLWSESHFKVLESYVKTLAALGQKAVTLVVSTVPWSGQFCSTERRGKANLFEYSIIPVKKTDGGFEYDYTKMQRYIDICRAAGISKELSLYGLVNVWCDESRGFIKPAPDYPDGIKIRYLDTDGTYKYMQKAEEIDGYIVSLYNYFKETNQLDSVRVTADEPADINAYRASVSHLKKLAPGFKIKAALDHAEFVPQAGGDLSDLVPSLYALSKEKDKIDELMKNREGKRFLWYVCNNPEYPNCFLRSELTDGWFIGILTSFLSLDGFLRWGYTAWNDTPRSDGRYFAWPAGDCYMVYPSSGGEAILSLRYKALSRGIQMFELMEKVRESGKDGAYRAACDIVMREKDVSKYYNGNSIAPKDKLFSSDYPDYMKMKSALLCELCKK